LVEVVVTVIASPRATRPYLLPLTSARIPFTIAVKTTPVVPEVETARSSPLIKTITTATPSISPPREKEPVG